MTRTRPRHASWRDLNALGAFVLEQMSDTDIVERRIETVTLMDAEHTERRVSLTIDADRLFDKATRHQTVTESNPGGLTVPFVIATPDKQLQLDMDASVAAGPIPILSSDDDARAAFAVIRQVLKRQKINLDRLSPAVQDELYSILRDEYTVERLLKIAEDTANVAPLKFSRRLSSEELRLLEWSRLLAIDELYDALVDLSQRYLLMAELPLNKPFTILKYRRIDGREHQGGWFRLAHLGLTPLKLDIESNTLWWKRVGRPLVRRLLKIVTWLLILGMAFSFFVEMAHMSMYGWLEPFNGLRHFIFDPIIGTIHNLLPH